MPRTFVLTTLALLALASPAGAVGEPIMALDQVTPGLRCTGLSVVRGVDVASFDVEIVDVLAGDPAQSAPRLLIRVSGPAVQPGGLGPGFSGSPVVCPDGAGVARIAGAISESIGQYGNTLALATPIESMLGEDVDPPAGVRHAPGLLRTARPIATPLSIGGLSPAVAAAVRRATTRSGRAFITAPAAPRAASFAPQVLRPGSAMAVGLASGAITAGAIGTVTYVDGDRVWGFGHPLDSVGRRSLLLQDAYVYAVVDNPLGVQEASTYKLAAPGHDLGILTADGINAVSGRLGVLPDRFDLVVDARDDDTGRLRQSTVSLADETGVGLPTGASSLSTVGPVAVAEAAYTALGAAPARQSDRMCVRIEVRERKRPLRFCNSYVGIIGGAAELAGAPLVSDFAEAVALVEAFDARRLNIERVAVNVGLRRGLRSAVIVDARAPARVRRGSTISVRLSLRRSGGGRLARTIRVRIPRGAPLGERDLTLTGTPLDEPGAPADGAGFEGLQDALDLEPEIEATPPPPTIAALAQAVAALGRYDGVRVSFRRPGAGDAGEDSDQPRGRRAYRDPELRIGGSAGVAVRVVR